jgi:hypothetical protein
MIKLLLLLPGLLWYYLFLLLFIYYYYKFELNEPYNFNNILPGIVGRGPVFLSSWFAGLSALLVWCFAGPLVCTKIKKYHHKY